MHLTPATLIDYLHRELPPGDDAKVLAHLEACSACTAELNAEAALSERLRAGARAETLDMPVGLRAAIFQRIGELEPTFWERLSAGLRPVVLVPLAVAAAASFLVFAPIRTHQPSTLTLPVSYYLEEHAAHVQENPLADRSAAIMMKPALVSLADDGAR